MHGGAPILRRTRFVTFDGGFESAAEHQRPDRYRHLEADFGTRKRIARGAGLSYAPASFGGESIVQEMTAFDRLLSFDPDRRTLRVEAGTEIGTLVGWSAQHRLCVPVVPGYPTITVGGCIAADVHGKNPGRDGTFCNWVEALTLYHPSTGFRSVDRVRDADAFHATCGGYGLTGIIVDATLRLAACPAPNVRVVHRPVESLEHAIRDIDAAAEADFAYSWHDGAARGTSFGRGILFEGRWTDEPCPDATMRYRRMTPETRGALPLGLWNPLTIRLANAWFRDRARRHATEVKSAFDAAFPFAKQTLYHRFFGRRGLAELQLLIPDASRDAFARALRALVERFDPPLAMLSIKRFNGTSRALGLSGTGTLLAMDMARSTATAAFLDRLDALAIESGAQPNLAKDSRIPVKLASGTLPAFGAFAETIRALDPDRLYASELSRRLEI